jgi:hypothetical protein
VRGGGLDVSNRSTTLPNKEALSALKGECDASRQAFAQDHGALH